MWIGVQRRTITARSNGGRAAPAPSFLFLRGAERHPPVPCAAVSRRIVGYRVLIAVAFRVETAGRDAQIAQLIHHGLSARLRQREIRTRVARIVGIAADLDAD